MTAAERRQEIMNVLVRRRNVTAGDLAVMFGVDERTIRADILELTRSYPIESVRGRYGGGYRLAGWFRPDRRLLTREQIDAIRKAAPFLSGRDQQALLSILTQFTAP